MPLSAIDVVDVVAVLCEVFAVAGIEGQSVAAGLQLGHIVVALPVFVARAVMWVEAKVIGTFEVLLGDRWNAKETNGKFIVVRWGTGDGGVMQELGVLCCDKRGKFNGPNKKECVCRWRLCFHVFTFISTSTAFYHLSVQFNSSTAVAGLLRSGDPIPRRDRMRSLLLC